MWSSKAIATCEPQPIAVPAFFRHGSWTPKQSIKDRWSYRAHHEPSSRVSCCNGSCLSRELGLLD